MVSDIFGVFPRGFVSLLMYELGYDAFIPRFKVETMVLSYLGILLFVVNILAWKLWKRTKRVRGQEMDLVTGRRIE